MKQYHPNYIFYYTETTVKLSPISECVKISKPGTGPLENFLIQENEKLFSSSSVSIVPIIVIVVSISELASYNTSNTVDGSKNK